MELKAKSKFTLDEEKERISMLKKKRFLNLLELAELTKTCFIKPVLDNLFKSNKRKLDKINTRLLRLVANEESLMYSFANLSRNKGSLTKGTLNWTADTVDMFLFPKLANNILDGSFKWTDIRRVLIPKPGKSTLRPLGIPNLYDRIVQESIRLVLNSIYEPIFQSLEVNFGFRAKRSPKMAISKIDREKQEMTHAIEGDIKGAYDNVNHDLLIKSLRRKINDKGFIDLIYKGLTANIFEEGRIIHPLTGVPQGGIASPTLFNIYMHEFDLAVINIVESTLFDYNRVQRRKRNATSKTYNRLKESTKKIKKEMEKNRDETSGKYLDFRLAIRTKEDLRKVNSKMLKTKSISQKRNWLTFSYTRYADDWIILTNASTEICNEMKEKISDWLFENLKLELSQEKTLVTVLEQEKAKFLGFTFRFNYKKRQVIKVIDKKQNRAFRRSLNVGLSIGIDHARVTNRLINDRVIDNNLRPIGVAKLLPYSHYEIVLKFRQKIIGLVNYYFHNITYKNELTRYYYYYRFSCAKTLARKDNISLAAVFKKRGSGLKVSRKEVIKTKKGDLFYSEQSINFPSCKEIVKRATILSKDKKGTDMSIQKKITAGRKGKKPDPKRIFINTGTAFIEKEDYSLLKVPFNNPFEEVLINQRIRFKFRKYCCICGCSPSLNNPLESHHIRHIRKGKIIGFAEIMRQLNRRQIIVCRNCHKKIHRGQYDGICLSDLYDPTIAEI